MKNCICGSQIIRKIYQSSYRKIIYWKCLNCQSYFQFRRNHTFKWFETQFIIDNKLYSVQMNDSYILIYCFSKCILKTEARDHLTLKNVQKYIERTVKLKAFI